MKVRSNDLKSVCGVLEHRMEDRDRSLKRKGHMGEGNEVSVTAHWVCLWVWCEGQETQEVHIRDLELKLSAKGKGRREEF